jgi:hypothetical protein
VTPPICFHGVERDKFPLSFLIKVMGSEYHLNNENGRILPEMQQAANESAYYAVTFFL